MKLTIASIERKSSLERKSQNPKWVIILEQKNRQFLTAASYFFNL